MMMMKGEANSTANRAGPGLSLGWAPESAVRWREVGLEVEAHFVDLSLNLDQNLNLNLGIKVG